MTYEPTSPETGVTGRQPACPEEESANPTVAPPFLRDMDRAVGEFNLSRFERSRASEMTAVCRASEHNGLAPGNKGGFRPR